jgi:hypothetical protein
MDRRWGWVLAVGLLLFPRVAWAQVVDLAGTWDTTAVVNAGPNVGERFLGWLYFSNGDEAIAGTFQATVEGVPISGDFSGTQAGGQIHGVGVASDPRPYQLTVDATVASDRQTFSGTWTDSDGRSGDYRGLRRSATLPEAGDAPWELLVAAWALLGAALLSRGARKRLV